MAHLDGSGATTFLIVVPAFLPICKKMGIRPQALLGTMCGAYGVMNLVPWGGPTMRAASVVGIEVGDLYSFIIPGVVCLVIVAFAIAFVVAAIEKKNGAGKETQAELEEKMEEKKVKCDGYDSYSVCSWYLHGCHQGLRHGRGNGADDRKCPSVSDRSAYALVHGNLLRTAHDDSRY